MAQQSHLPESPDGAQPSDDASPYVVGYRRPPAHTRFKPGHPGRGGRPKKQRNVRTVLKNTLDERITIREGKRTRSVSKLDAVILRLVNEAVSGNAKAQSNLITLMRSQGLIEQPQEATNSEPFTTDDLAIIADFLGRHGDQAEPTQPHESNEKAEAGKAEPASKETKETNS
jgi:uncharacterized protein DUF5681